MRRGFASFGSPARSGPRASLPGPPPGSGPRRFRGRKTCAHAPSARRRLHLHEHGDTPVEEIPEEQFPADPFPGFPRGDLPLAGGRARGHPGLRLPRVPLQRPVVHRPEKKLPLLLKRQRVEDQAIPRLTEGKDLLHAPGHRGAPEEARLPHDVGDEEHLAVHRRGGGLVDTVPLGRARRPGGKEQENQENGDAGIHVDSSKEMSREGAEWVIAPTATAATPVRAYSSMFPRWIPPDASRRTISPKRATASQPRGRRSRRSARRPPGPSHHRRGHIVEEDRVGPRRDRRLHVRNRLRLDLDAKQVVRRRTRRGDRRGDPPDRADPVLLDQDPVRKGEPVVRPAPHPDGVLLENPEQRRRFPRVEKLRAVGGDPRSVEGRRGGHAREPLEEVQGHPLRSQERGGGTGRVPDPVAPGHATPFGGEGNGNGRVDLAEHLRRHRPAAQHPVTPRQEKARRVSPDASPKGSPNGASSRRAARTISSYRCREITPGIGSPARSSSRAWRFSVPALSRGLEGRRRCRGGPCR